MAPGGKSALYDITIDNVDTRCAIAVEERLVALTHEFRVRHASAVADGIELLPGKVLALVAESLQVYQTAREQLRDQAVAAATAGEPTFTATLSLPASALEAAPQMHHLLEQADALSRDLELDVAPAPEEEHAFWAWMSDQIVAALRQVVSTDD